MAYGIYMNASGFSFIYPLCMSLLIYGGSLEFVAVEMLLSPFAPIQVFIMALLIQARHLFSTDFPCWINIREYWVASATFGDVIGSLLPINTEGISFVMTAMFVVIFMDQWLKEKNHTSSLLGLGISFLCLLVFGPDSFMIPTMILIIVSLTLLRKKLDIPDQKNYSRHHFDKCASEKMK